MSNSKKKRKEAMLTALENEKHLHPPAVFLPPEIIKRLRLAGLSIGDGPFFPPTHVSTPSGYVISLTESGENPLTSINIWLSEGRWNLEVHNWIPGPGPGDFCRPYESLEDAFEKIISYFHSPNDLDRCAFLDHASGGAR